jgi:SAM-dependent methyltransferase
MLIEQSNRELYAGVEFQTWLQLQDLNPQERYVIDTYLQRDLPTVEAGVNGGRILFNLRQMGFTSLAGFDYVPELIDVARSRDREGTIDFQVGNATALTYADNSFEQILYLQQLISLIDVEADRLNALKESYRILKPGGIGLFSFLSFESRQRKPVYNAYLAYLQSLRRLRGVDTSIQYQPWLVLGGKFNPNALLDRSPHTYWYRVSEIYELLQSIGYRIVALGAEAQIAQGSLVSTDRELRSLPISGMLYAIVTK